MGLSSTSHTHKAFLLTNYMILGTASGCIFLTLSLRLVPSPCGLLLLFLHSLTAISAALSCSTAGGRPAYSHAAHTAASSLTAIFQGAVSLLALTRTSDFLTELRSYVREEDGEVILKMVGGLGLAIFVLEWVVLALAFILRLDEEGAEGNNGIRSSTKIGSEEQMKDWPWPFQV